MSESKSHKGTKYILADTIEDIIESKETSLEVDVFVEKGLESDQVNNIADVRVDIPHEGFQGFVFEVKTRCINTERVRSIFQMAKHLRAGYHPVLVAPAEFYCSEKVEVRPRHHGVQYKRLTRALDADIINVSKQNGLQFSPVSYQYETIKDLLFSRIQ